MRPPLARLAFGVSLVLVLSSIAMTVVAIVACGIDVTGGDVAPNADDSGASSSSSSGSSGSSGSTSGGIVDGSSGSGDGAVGCIGSACDVVDGGDAGPVFELEVTIKGGGGAVTSNPSGISCPTTCKALVPSGTNVVLNAAPTPGGLIAFVEWGGAASGRDPSTSVNVTGPTLVSADFAGRVHYAHTLTQLFTVTPVSGAATVVAAFSGPCAGDVADIALDRKLNMYAVTRAGGNTLHTVNRATALCGPSLGSVQRFCNSLTFAPSPSDPKADQLYAGCGSDFYRINHTNGTPTFVGALGGEAAGDVGYAPGFGIFVTLNGPGRFGKVNLANGSAALVKSDPAFSGIYGLGFANGHLLGYGDNTTIAIDPTTGNFTSLTSSSITSGCWGGASGP